MNESPHEEGDLAEEFRQLGKNLVDTLRLAWDSPARKRLHNEIEAGLTEIAASLKKEADEFRASASGQQLKEEIDDIKRRWGSGEAEAKARQELINAIRMANDELKNWAEKWQKNAENENQGSENP